MIGARFKPYPEYKDSGIEWLGQIPEHWELRRLKRLATINDEALPETTNPDFEMSYVDIGSVDAIEGITHRETYVFANAPSRARRIARHGDVIVSTVRTYLRAIAPIVHPEPNLIVSTGFAIIRPRTGLATRFSAYALRSPYFVERVVANSVGVSYPAINASELGTFPIAAPPEVEQQAIADFLDRETAKIDAAVKKQERLIELLQEKRTALITHAVTKGLPAAAAAQAGLDPNVPMRNSGIERIGHVPAHWTVRKTTWVFSIGSGTTPNSEDPSYYDGDIPWITTSELRETVITATTKQITTKALDDFSSLRVHPEGSVAVAMYGATIGRLGILGMPATVNQACCVFSQPQGVNMQFWFYWLQMRRTYLVSLGYGGGQPNLSQELLRSIRAPVPPEKEQQAIADFLDRETAKIDALIAKIQEAINRLKEYRTALISAAVTGKIDVRNE
jgi:type I restriction enzyme S subunit